MMNQLLQAMVTIMMAKEAKEQNEKMMQEAHEVVADALYSDKVRITVLNKNGDAVQVTEHDDVDTVHMLSEDIYFTKMHNPEVNQAMQNLSEMIGLEVTELPEFMKNIPVVSLRIEDGLAGTTITNIHKFMIDLDECNDYVEASHHGEGFISSEGDNVFFRVLIKTFDGTEIKVEAIAEEV